MIFRILLIEGVKQVFFFYFLFSRLPTARDSRSPSASPFPESQLQTPPFFPHPCLKPQPLARFFVQGFAPKLPPFKAGCFFYFLGLLLAPML